MTNGNGTLAWRITLLVVGLIAGLLSSGAVGVYQAGAIRTEMRENMRYIRVELTAVNTRLGRVEGKLDVR